MRKKFNTKEKSMAFFRIYGREKGKTRFKAIDLENGVFVNNLIHASFFIAKDDAENV